MVNTMNELEHVIHLLKNKNATLDENNIRLYWKAGWKVITWKRGKAIELYFGDSFSEALKVFESKTKEEE